MYLDQNILTEKITKIHPKIVKIFKNKKSFNS